MKNMIEKMLVVVVMCMSFTLVPNGKAYAAQKMTVSEMKSVTGETNIPGDRCITQPPACSDAITVSSGYCWATHPVAYSACSTGNPSDTCTPVKVRTCIRNYYQPADANGNLESATPARCVNDGVYENTIYNEDAYTNNGC